MRTIHESREAYRRMKARHSAEISAVVERQLAEKKALREQCPHQWVSSVYYSTDYGTYYGTYYGVRVECAACKLPKSTDENYTRTTFAEDIR